MSEERRPWDQMDGEKSTDYHKFVLFRDMPAHDRSFLGAYKLALAKSAKNREGARPPHTIPASWRACADKWQWQKRADAYDAHVQAENEAKAERLKQLEEEEEARLLSTGYARSARRIEQLSLLFDELKASYHEEGKPDGKVVYQWLTPDKVREMRGCLDDIAKEVGERVKKAELSGKDGGPMEFFCEWGSGAVNDAKEEA